MANLDTIYVAIGGQPVVDRIIDSLYKHIGVNEMLLPIFPNDLEESARKQRLFLTQFFGGPNLYAQERGRPMLPYRHAPFEITPARRDAWLQCMHQALVDVYIEEPYFSDILGRLVIAAQNIVNTQETPAENIQSHATSTKNRISDKK